MPYGGVSQFTISLFVNLDHVAVMNAAEAGNGPNPADVALMCEKGGCAGIAVSLYKDRRYIQDREVFAMREAIPGRLCLNITLSDEIIQVAREVKPDQITIMLENGAANATQHISGIRHNMPKIQETVNLFRDKDIPVSILIEPAIEAVELAKECGAAAIRIHTAAYAKAVDKASVDQEVDRIYRAADRAFESGMGVGAGGGLNYANMDRVLGARGLVEVHVGRAIFARSALLGVPAAVIEILELLE